MSHRRKHLPVYASLRAFKRSARCTRDPSIPFSGRSSRSDRRFSPICLPFRAGHRGTSPGRPSVRACHETGTGACRGREVTPRFFANPSELRQWFRENHDKADELWVGYYKKGSGIPSVDWPESVDAALCFGWIDGIRKRLDEKSYKIRFTPRRARSNWSARNIARMEALIADGLVREAGLSAFRARVPKRQTAPAGKWKQAKLPRDYESRIRADRDAWHHFQSARPSYRKQVASWILSAKKEGTRLRRLEVLVECSKRGDPIPPLRWSEKRKQPSD